MAALELQFCFTALDLRKLVIGNSILGGYSNFFQQLLIIFEPKNKCFAFFSRLFNPAVTHSS